LLLLLDAMADSKL